MTNLEIIKRMRRMDKLIKMKATGSPKEFAEKIELSESQLYEMLIEMKDMGAPLNYNRIVRSYTYEEEGDFLLGWKRNKN